VKWPSFACALCMAVALPFTVDAQSNPGSVVANPAPTTTPMQVYGSVQNFPTMITRVPVIYPGDQMRPVASACMRWAQARQLRMM
jgi:hypothetical protein